MKVIAKPPVGFTLHGSSRPNTFAKSPKNVIAKREVVSNTKLLNSIAIDTLSSLSYIAHTSTPLTSRRCDDAVLVIVKKLDTSQISAILFDSTIHLLPTTEKQLYLIYDADICYRQICWIHNPHNQIRCYSIHFLLDRFLISNCTCKSLRY